MSISIPVTRYQWSFQWLFPGGQAVWPVSRGPMELSGRPVSDVGSFVEYRVCWKAKMLECSQPVCNLGRLEEFGPTGAMLPKNKEEMSTEGEFFSPHFGEGGRGIEGIH